MYYPTTLSLTEARRKIFKLTKAVQRPGAFYMFTQKGRAKAVLMSADEFASWLETLEIMWEYPDLKKDLARVEKDIQSGAYLRYPTLEQVLAKRNYARRPLPQSHRAFSGASKTVSRKNA